MKTSPEPTKATRGENLVFGVAMTVIGLLIAMMVVVTWLGNNPK